MDVNEKPLLCCDENGKIMCTINFRRYSRRNFSREFVCLSIFIATTSDGAFVTSENSQKLYRWEFHKHLNLTKFCIFPFFLVYLVFFLLRLSRAFFRCRYRNMFVDKVLVLLLFIVLSDDFFLPFFSSSLSPFIISQSSPFGESKNIDGICNFSGCRTTMSSTVKYKWWCCCLAMLSIRAGKLYREFRVRN